MNDSITIGRYKIQWVSEDMLTITIDYDTFTDTATVCGGDFETILSALFVTTVKGREYKNEYDHANVNGAGENN